MVEEGKQLPEIEIINEISNAIDMDEQKNDRTEAVRIEEKKRFEEVNLYEYVSEDQEKLMLVALRENLSQVIFQKEYAYTRVTEFLVYMYESIEDNPLVINALKQIKQMDEYTFTHSIHTAFYSMFIAMWMELPAPIIRQVTQAGLLHDLGKVYVPGRILNKRGPLTTEEYELMKKHPLYGYAMIHEFTTFHRDVKRAVLLHHERLDGGGYPLSAQGDYIGMMPKIIAVADSYDAMTTDRVYKRAFKAEEAVNILKAESKTLFDHGVLTAFLENIPIYDFKRESA
ncbi:HD-GYP domain-containing protein [Eubacteriaceae bacterium ES3]|nr:HD-GYP domain-containing protein [Eubacteriaceae bacterium ES3]